MLVDGQPPKVEYLDQTTVRYTWAKPNPDFLPLMAGASPLLIYRPAHYLRQFHKKHAPKVVEAQKAEPGKRSWAAVHNREDNMYQFDNPKLPTLQPWVNTTKPPTDRFISVRNPYFHRVDPAGRQLPYIDRVVMPVVDGKLIPAKAGAGESDLQARDIQFNNYTFLKKAEKTNNFKTHLWRTAKGSHIALYPNLNVADPVWRQLMRDVRFRRALSQSIDRAQINQVLYFGLASESNNTVVPESPLFKKEYQTQWAKFDRKAADKLFDEIGLKRGPDGIRRLSDGRPLEIIVETAGESTEQTDVLELVRESWREVGIKLFSKPSQRDLLRNRVFSGEAMMSVWQGWTTALPRPTPPRRAGTQGPGAAAVAQVRSVLRDRGQVRRGTGFPAGHRVDEAVGVLAQRQHGRADPHLASDAGDSRRSAIHDRHRQQRDAAGGGAQRIEERAGERPVQLGSGRLAGHAPTRCVLVHRRAQELIPCCSTRCGACC